MDYRVKPRRVMAALAALFILCFVLSCLLGRYPIYPSDFFKVLLSRFIPMGVTWTPQTETVIFEIRLPRTAMCALIGAGLSCSGCVYQKVFQNPIASPDILGATNGAGFGASLGILLGFGYSGISISAFLGGLAAVGLVYLVSMRFRGNKMLCIILTGMMISALGTAGTSYVKLIADTSNQLPAITYWLMGSLASIRRQDALFSAPIIVAGLIPLFLLRWRINILTSGDDVARSMGVDAVRLRGVTILCATLVTSACVSVSGVIGWVGLVIPHFARMLVGSDCRWTLPASMLLGGSFLLAVDDFARLITTSEIPIGILTAFVSAPFFFYLILREGNRL